MQKFLSVVVSQTLLDSAKKKKKGLKYSFGILSTGMRPDQDYILQTI